MKSEMYTTVQKFGVFEKKKKNLLYVHQGCIWSQI